MSNSNVYLRRRLTAVGALVLVALLVFLGSQLFAAGNNQAEPAVVETTEAEQMNQEIANCQPGVVEVEAFIGRGPMHEALTNIPEGEEAFLWYEITNTGFVDCIFDVGTYATFFTITSGEQVFFSSRDCDREGDSKSSRILKPNIVEKSDPGESWLKVYSSSEFECGEDNPKVPLGGAAYDIRVEVSGVISEKKRFYLF
jgi:hypothetical protein